ncbi:uncharacterized protein At5g39570-like [Phalaenopsis equestris]|uniref:uncharacterized protein At5g39570-like n=1 Tax=Phalaenopsis equestris TaxID=78828 RepID=UPI0009E248FD|nr:uncharacterized protein At5g39570-like [Phalaenopsis equestris]
MSSWGLRGMSVDSFEGYDPTPYSGGYDLSLTYGRPLQPTDEICYPVSAAGDVDLERPRYSSGSHNSAFETDNTKKSDCYGLLRPGFEPQRQPQPVSNPWYTGYGHQSYGYGGGSGASDYGSVYGGRPQFPEQGFAYGQGYGQRPQHQEFRSEYGSEYEGGRKPPSGSGYGREGLIHYGDEGFRRSEEEGYGRQGFGGNDYRRNEEEVGGDGGFRKNSDYVYGGNTSYDKPSYGAGEEVSGGKNSNYGNQYQSTEYGKPSYYGTEEGERYGHSKFGNDSDDVEQKHHHHKHHHRHY